MGYEVVGGLVNDAGIEDGVAFNMLRLNPGVENSRCLTKIFHCGGTQVPCHVL